MIKYFNIIQALSRTALANPNEAILHQIQRLKDSLEKDGHNKEAKSLDGLLLSSKYSMDMSPSKIQKSFVITRGESLTVKTPTPVDKETSTPLAEIFFPLDMPPEIPLLDDNIQLAIQSIVNEWMKFDQLSEINAMPASSCLIYGAPGTGKTHLAKWIAKQIGLPVVLARLEGLMSSFLGTTSRNIGNLFAFANRYNCVLLLDEFDAIAKLRNDPQEVGEVKRVVNTLLQSLDSRHEKGFTIGVTNHESLLDPAIWRRFDIQIEIPKPSPEVMVHLLGKFLKPLEFQENEIKFLAWCLEGASGADAKILSKWFKRAFVLEKENSIVDVMRQFALLNSGRVNIHKRNIMLHSDEDFIAMLLNDKIYSFKQKDIASLFGITPSSLSKQLSKYKDSEKN
ncbi:AAA family ATPase [Aequorivita antarctica]|uniref:ATP-binding protein n=1 Tax=Aequorivita antarctica TaxID=153266 RepID=A0A5C6Z044_9FLAO|nr:ATP-binding protein [Aequorivita antarctica]TXD73319.1 ATP-binding protein [Aequorivita antarctica]SRX76431.1 ATP-dependent zinc metalloprotease FtsH [Aequorivita antarctica]